MAHLDRLTFEALTPDMRLKRAGGSPAACAGSVRPLPVGRVPPVPRFSPIQAPFPDRHFPGRLSGERMRIASLAMITVGLAPCLAVPGASQICAGSTSFTRAPLQVSGSAEVTTHAHSFGVGLALGGPATFFGVGLGTTHFDALHGSSFDVAAGGGYELPLDQQGSVQLCPVVAVRVRSSTDRKP